MEIGSQGSFWHKVQPHFPNEESWPWPPTAEFLRIRHSLPLTFHYMLLILSEFKAGKMLGFCFEFKYTLVVSKILFFVLELPNRLPGERLNSSLDIF